MCIFGSNHHSFAENKSNNYPCCNTSPNRSADWVFNSGQYALNSFNLRRTLFSPARLWLMNLLSLLSMTRSTTHVTCLYALFNRAFCFSLTFGFFLVLHPCNPFSSNLVLTGEGVTPTSSNSLELYKRPLKESDIRVQFWWSVIDCCLLFPALSSDPLVLNHC